MMIMKRFHYFFLNEINIMILFWGIIYIYIRFTIIFFRLRFHGFFGQFLIIWRILVWYIHLWNIKNYGIKE